VLRYPHRMGLENPLHIILLLVVILLVFGAKRLPEIGRSLGEGLRGFKDSISGESHHQDSLTSAPAAAPPAPAPAPAPATVAPTAAPAPPTAAPVEDTAASPSPSAS
jgi:sec-independent protein translocase protein TatA